MLYHAVFPAKYRKKIFTESIEDSIKEICLQIAQRYEVHFLEIGIDEDHVHFLLQSVPAIAPKRLIQIIKSLTAKEIFKRHPEVKKLLWGGHFWTTGYYINTVGQYANEKVIQEYVEKQGKRYKQIHRGQLLLFEGTD